VGPEQVLRAAREAFDAYADDARRFAVFAESRASLSRAQEAGFHGGTNEMSVPDASNGADPEKVLRDGRRAGRVAKESRALFKTIRLF